MSSQQQRSTTGTPSDITITSGSPETASPQQQTTPTDPPQKRFRCETCGAKFQRNQHLRRHQSQHLEDVQYVCEICERSFKRSDVLRLHYSRCHQQTSSGEGYQLPLKTARGRKRKACDRCAKYKRACDNNKPCSVCLSRNIPCTYKAASSAAEGAQRPSPKQTTPSASTSTGNISENLGQETSDGTNVKSDTITPSTSLPELSETAEDVVPNDDVSFFSAIDPVSNYYDDLFSPALIQQPQMCLDRPPTVPIKFLVNLTTVEGLASRFNFAFFQSRHKSRCPRSDYSVTLPEHSLDVFCPPASSTQSSDLLDWSWCLSNVNTDLVGPLGAPTSYMFSSALEGFLGHDETFESFELSTATSTTNTIFNSSTMLDCLADPLFTKTRDIWTNLRNTSMKKTKSYEKTGFKPLSDAQSMACLDFFSPQNIRKYLEIFFDDWFPHCPIVHKPTFDPVHAATQLVLAMCLIGASLSPDQRNRRLAEQWYDMAEEYIFEEQGLNEECLSWIHQPIDGKLFAKRPQVLQAAGLIGVLRTWEPDSKAKTRIRRHRHNILIAKVRSIGFSRATHYRGRCWDQDPFDWSKFIATEELIRTFMFTYLVDCSYVIFNNAPARLLTKELGCDLVCPDPCFQAEDAETCRQHLMRLLAPNCVRGTLSLCEAVRILYYNDFNDNSFAAFLQLDSFNLFTIITNLHTSVLCQSTSLFGVAAFEPYIRNALDTWQLIWNARADLNYVLSTELQSSVIPWKRIGFFQHAGEYRTYALGVLTYMQAQSGAGAHWPSVSSLTPKVLAPLPKYDETSMEQVARLLVTLDAEVM